MTDRPGSDRFGILVAVLGGLLVALAALLIIFLVTRDDDGATTTAAASTTLTTAPTTTSDATTTTAAETTTTAATTTTAVTTTTTTAPFAGDTDPKSGTGAFGLLTGVRIGDHEGYTRIVFDFQEPDFPNWEFAYVPGEIEGMAGPEGGWVEGDAFLVARFQPSSTADLSGSEVVMTYDGPRRIDVGLGSVVQLLIIEDFEANLWWAIGLTGEKPFSVGTMTGPPRIYVDIAD
ncbi:MAG TPA: hypothetical protein VLS92_10655 [Acidimicrobiia bacterium]|nr:hypothetical protein [Acidimicrobiia bacterium]